MSAPGSSSHTTASTAPEFSPAAEAAGRVPLFILFASAAIWALAGSVLSLLSSLKFHSPEFLAQSAWLTYGRIRPAGVNAMLYGFGMQAGLGTALWLLARLGRTQVALTPLLTLGAVFWNAGVTIGVAGILLGDSTGFELLEMPGYAAVILLVGYLALGLSGVLTFHQRRESSLFVSQWFVFTALFWFPWVYSSAELLLVSLPVRGVTQAVLTWWYGANLLVVWFGLIGLAAVFYFVPKLAGRPLHSHYLALFVYWMLVLFGSWSGIPPTAPLPAWLPVLSTVSTILLALPVVGVVLNLQRTLAAAATQNAATPPTEPEATANPVAACGWRAVGSTLPGRFVLFGALAFVAALLAKLAGALLDQTQQLHLTWFSAGQFQLYAYGFFGLVMFGSIYYVLPRLAGQEFPWARLARVHFWLAALGVLLVAVPLMLGGIGEATRLTNPNLAFVDVFKGTLVFLRIATTGDLLLVLGHCLFLVNAMGLIVRLYRARAAAAYEAATTNLYAAEVKA